MSNLGRLTPSKLKVLKEAGEILEEIATYAANRPALTGPNSVKLLLRTKLAAKESEAFAVLFLDNQHKLISYEELFYGTIDGSSVHPRVVVKRALEVNAAAVIFAHNHPSGVTEPSQADQRITDRLKSALLLVDIRVLDHIIVGAGEEMSFAERGLI